MTRIGAHNPPRATGAMPKHLSAGKLLTATRYVVGWPDAGVVKVGSSLHGRRRYGAFLTRGAHLLDVAYYERLMDSLHAEYWLMHRLGDEYPQAFTSRRDATDFLPKGAGWTECFSIDPGEWDRIVELANQREDA